VTWQEELSQLDGALATGQISADDYRRERERILAVATGGIQQGPPQGGQGPGQGAPPVNRGSDAFPPPFKWTTERPNQGGEDTTQAVPTKSQASPAESTQIVNASDSTQIVDMKDQASMGPGPSFGDRTQVVSQVPLNSPPQGTPAPWAQQGPPQGGPGGPGGWGPQQQQGTPWENQEELVPPWSGGYQAQGAELFDAEPSSGKGKVWAIVGVVVLLVAIAGGVLWLTVFNKKDDGGTAGGGNQQQEQPTRQQPQTPEKPEPFGPLYVPEGTTKGGKTYSAAELEESNVLPPPDLVLIKQAGLTEAKAVVVVKDSTTIDLWAFGTNDPAQLVEDVTTDQDRFGYKKVAGEAVQGVEVYTSQQKSANRTVFVYRAHYTNGDNMIRVQAFGEDKAKAKAQFDAVLEAQLELTPPE
jgi:hypothetical protein